MDDPRQSIFTQSLGHLKVGLKKYDIVTNDRNNLFKASHVNLGWLQAAIERRKLRKRGDIYDFIQSCVQRMKYCEVDIKEEYTTVVFKTKDDMGYYTYEFGVNHR